MNLLTYIKYITLKYIKISKKNIIKLVDSTNKYKKLQ